MFTAGIVLFTLASALVRARAVAYRSLIAARVVQAVGRRVARARVARARRRSLPGRAARARRRPVGRGGRARRRARAAARRRARASSTTGASSFSINLPLGVAAVRPRRGATSSRAARRGGERLPDLRGALLLGGRASRCSRSAIVQGDDWGWTSLERDRRVRRRVQSQPACSSRARVGTRFPVLDPKLLRIRSFAVAQRGDVRRRGGLLRVPAEQHPLAALRVGLVVAARGSRASRPAQSSPPLVAGRLGRARRPRTATASIAVPGALVWAAAYVWYASSVGTASGFPRASGCRGRCCRASASRATLPILGERGARGGARRALRDGVVGRVERAATRRRDRRCGPRRDRRHAEPRRRS